MHYFSSSGGTSTDGTKNYAGTCDVKHLFLNLAGSAAHVVHSGASGVSNVDTLFFLLRWDQYRSQKKRTGIRYAEHVFLHPAGSAAHVVHFDASEARNIDALLFMLRWDR
jgi:hypothetical protein